MFSYVTICICSEIKPKKLSLISKFILKYLTWKRDKTFYITIISAFRSIQSYLFRILKNLRPKSTTFWARVISKSDSIRNIPFYRVSNLKVYRYFALDLLNYVQNLFKVLNWTKGLKKSPWKFCIDELILSGIHFQKERRFWPLITFLFL